MHTCQIVYLPTWPMNTTFKCLLRSNSKSSSTSFSSANETSFSLADVFSFTVKVAQLFIHSKETARTAYTNKYSLMATKEISLKQASLSEIKIEISFTITLFFKVVSLGLLGMILCHQIRNYPIKVLKKVICDCILGVTDIHQFFHQIYWHDWKQTSYTDQQTVHHSFVPPLLKAKNYLLIYCQTIRRRNMSQWLVNWPTFFHLIGLHNFFCLHIWIRNTIINFGIITLKSQRENTVTSENWLTFQIFGFPNILHLCILIRNPINIFSKVPSMAESRRKNKIRKTANHWGRVYESFEMIDNASLLKFLYLVDQVLMHEFPPRYLLILETTQLVSNIKIWHNVVLPTNSSRRHVR